MQRQRSKTEKVQSVNDLKQGFGLPNVYERVLRAGATKDKVYFSFTDMVYRYALTVLMYYWCLLTSPMAFAYYTYKHHILWYGPIVGLGLFCFLPIMPVGIAIIVLFQKIKGLFVTDWMMEGPGRVFFVKPEGLISSFLWDCYLNQSMYVGQFFLAGTNQDSIQHTWQDLILTKDYWRSALTKVGARLPREVGRWTGDRVEWLYPLGSSDVVVKLPDAYLGIGDSFWNHGEDYNTQKDLEQRLAKEYEGKTALVLELVRPKKAMGVHSLDMVTLRTPDDQVKVLSVILWTDCTTSSSHSCHAGYTVDIESETIVAPVSWYSPFFSKQKSPLIGTKCPGLKAAVEQCVQAHNNLSEKWLVAVGWDCMIQEGDVAVFFEGNFAGARTPRRIFLSWTLMKEFITSYFWPFGNGTSARPGRQSYGGAIESISAKDFMSFGLKSSLNNPEMKATTANLTRDQQMRSRSVSM